MFCEYLDEIIKELSQEVDLIFGKYPVPKTLIELSSLDLILGRI